MNKITNLGAQTLLACVRKLDFLNLTGNAITECSLITEVASTEKNNPQWFDPFQLFEHHTTSLMTIRNDVVSDDETRFTL